MKRLRATFSRLKRERRCGLFAYLTCGDPDLETTIEIARALERAGADAIELGVPFSDPIADGPVIQAASLRALQRGTTTQDVLRAAAEIRRSSEIPLIAFSYLNPILRYGEEQFVSEAAGVGMDGLLVTDLPPEAAATLRRASKASGIASVFLLAPTSPDSRLKLIDRASSGFVYYVSTTGVTGTRRELDPALVARLADIRGKLKNRLAVGFGISTRAHYEALAPHCDAVVVGSAIVRAITDGDSRGAASRAAAIVREIIG